MCQLVLYNLSVTLINQHIAKKYSDKIYYSISFQIQINVSFSRVISVAFAVLAYLVFRRLGSNQIE